LGSGIGGSHRHGGPSFGEDSEPFILSTSQDHVFPTFITAISPEGLDELNPQSVLSLLDCHPFCFHTDGLIFIAETFH
jgi:hypothetical protein